MISKPCEHVLKDNIEENTKQFYMSYGVYCFVYSHTRMNYL